MQVVNRDLSVAVLRQFVKLRDEDLQSGKLKIRPTKKAKTSHNADAANGKPNEQKFIGTQQEQDGIKTANQIRVLEGLAASGLRAIRYAFEVCISSIFHLCPAWR